jgi:hypothetical protein
MQITTEELRQHYASLSDEELRDLDPADLTDAARKVYEVERQKRHPAAQVSPSAETRVEAAEEEDDVEPDWLENAACACSFQSTAGTNYAGYAASARDVLLAAGVPCQLSIEPRDPENAGEQPNDEYRVLVPSALNLKAMSVLDKEIFNSELEQQWRGHFATLSDDELRALSPEVICGGLIDRVERLTRAYRNELERRGSGSG